MKHAFTKQYMKDNSGCYSYSDYEQLNKCSFMKTESDITLESIVNSEIPLTDKFWFVCKKVLSIEQNQQVAISVAEVVLPFFEKRHPNDLRPREAIEAAKQYIAGYISPEALLIKRKPTCSSYSAAYAAYDSAYANAVYANVGSYDSATNTAYAAYTAVHAAAAYSTYASSIKQQLWDILINITMPDLFEDKVTITHL